MGMSRRRARPAASTWTRAPALLRGFAIASVVANVLIVVTGGAVRLTGSGLGCPTWPTCQGGSLTPTGPSSYHKVIEFTNRQLTCVLIAIALVTAAAGLAAASRAAARRCSRWRSSRCRRSSAASAC